MVKTPTVLSATEAARGFGELLARVRYGGEEFLIRRGRTVVAKLGPVPLAGVTGASAAAAWRRAPHLSAAEARAFDGDVERTRKAWAQPPRDPWAR